MAEAMVNNLWGERFEAISAGFSPAPLNPLAIEVMQEWNMDISRKQSQSVFELFRKGQLVDYVITVCDEAGAEQCPVFPGITRRLHWSFPDPALFGGTHEERLHEARILRNSIKARLEEWMGQLED